MIEDNKRNTFNKSHFSKNIKSLFNKESKKYYSKHRLNIKLKSLISKEKTLNDRKIMDFNYGEMFHFFKVGMKKFDDSQLKRKNFYKTLYDENTRFNKEYQKNYSANSQITLKQTKPNIKSKIFQKYYDKHKITDTSKKVNNLFNRDPLLVSNNDIKLFYMGKEPQKDEFKDEALDYVNKLEININQKSVLNKMRQSLNEKRKKEKKLSLNKEKEFPLIDDNHNTNNSEKKINKIKNLKSDINKNFHKKYSIDIKRYNHHIKVMLSKLNKTNNDYYSRNNNLNNENSSKTDIYDHQKRYNSLRRNKNNYISMDYDNKNTDYYSSSEKANKNLYNLNYDINKKKKDNKTSNQIESLYNELFKIKQNINKYEKRNENDLRYLYTVFGNNSGKKIKQSFVENKKLIKLDKELVFSVNSFND